MKVKTNQNNQPHLIMNNKRISNKDESIKKMNESESFRKDLKYDSV